MKKKDRRKVDVEENRNEWNAMKMKEKEKENEWKEKGGRKTRKEGNHLKLGTAFQNLTSSSSLCQDQGQHQWISGLLSIPSLYWHVQTPWCGSNCISLIIGKVMGEKRYIIDSFSVNRRDFVFVSWGNFYIKLMNEDKFVYHYINNSIFSYFFFFNQIFFLYIININNCYMF